MPHRICVRVIVIVTLVLLLVIVAVDRVHACSCVTPGPPAAELEAATAVFSGKVLRADVGGGEVTSSADPVWVGFQVFSVWKGPALTTLVVTTARESASCGYPFEVGREYLVYSGGTWDALGVSLCSRTRLLAEAEADLVVLGPGTEMQPEATDTAQPRTVERLWIALPVCVAAVALGAAIIYRRWARPTR
jgi:hypothetical protein